MARYKIITFSSQAETEVERDVNEFLDVDGRRLVNVSMCTYVDPDPSIEELPTIFVACVAYIDEDIVYE